MMCIKKRICLKYPSFHQFPTEVFFFFYDITRLVAEKFETKLTTSEFEVASLSRDLMQNLCCEKELNICQRNKHFGNQRLST